MHAISLLVNWYYYLAFHAFWAAHTHACMGLHLCVDCRASLQCRQHEPRS
jgi:hypothetical protein